MGKQSVVEWPAWYYGPDGAAQVFKSPEEVPEGWVDSMSKAAAKEWSAPKPEPEVKPEPEAKSAPKPKAKPRGRPARKLKAKADVAADARREALSALREAGAEVSDDATDEDLQKALDALE